MFDKFKQLKQMKELQDSLKKESVEVDKDGVRIVVNGKMEVESVTLSEEMPIKEQEKAVKDGMNEAFRKVQTIAAQKMGMI